MFNLRAFTTLIFSLSVSARAKALDSPSSEQVREACSLLTQRVVADIFGVLLLLAVIGVVRYLAYRMARD